MSNPPKMPPKVPPRPDPDHETTAPPWIVWLSTLWVCIGLAGCSPLTLLNAVSPDRSYSLTEGIAYGDHPRQKLDLAVPRETPARGTVLFFYGGGWTGGDRKDFHFVIEAFAQAGYAVALPDYRVYPEVRFPAFVEDGAKALSWLVRHGEDAGAPTRPLFIAGHSAGAHIAAMLTFDERFRQDVGLREDPIAAFAGLSGPYDFLPLTSDLLKSIFSPAEQRPMSQPVNFIDGDEAPALLIHGDADRTAWPRNSRRLAARIREAGGTVEEHYLPGIGHRRVALALSTTFDGVAPVVPTVLAFFRSHEGDQVAANRSSAAGN